MTSVDAERVFSGGRLQVNHLQHQMSSQSFKAQVAVGSWYDTPLLTNMNSTEGRSSKPIKIEED
ncbi:hypothetical protein SCLCIDRAFT_1221362 [Scleroderma citrinum Foug A]|uniref:HAT C-terminal dimerisation domain-containing protein n=1 Tax=Scleroderma citrinum Foug A TaxID=1036808 RepID=A0A0C2Z064_9AGAM|nr:hypothetical protein SCLCIDRAFT_1221362 [Scleroderma citrinum Foug A]